MEELFVEGKRYISSKRASNVSSYSKDYIGQLCRANKLDCRLVGRTWYVNEHSLYAHRVEVEDKQRELRKKVSNEDVSISRELPDEAKKEEEIAHKLDGLRVMPVNAQSTDKAARQNEEGQSIRINVKPKVQEDFRAEQNITTLNESNKNIDLVHTRSYSKPENVVKIKTQRRLFLPTLVLILLSALTLGFSLIFTSNYIYSSESGIQTARISITNDIQAYVKGLFGDF